MRREGAFVSPFRRYFEDVSSLRSIRSSPLEHSREIQIEMTFEYRASCLEGPVPHFRDGCYLRSETANQRSNQQPPFLQSLPLPAAFASRAKSEFGSNESLARRKQEDREFSQWYADSAGPHCGVCKEALASMTLESGNSLAITTALDNQYPACEALYCQLHARRMTNMLLLRPWRIYYSYRYYRNAMSTGLRSGDAAERECGHRSPGDRQRSYSIQDFFNASEALFGTRAFRCFRAIRVSQERQEIIELVAIA